MLYRQHAALSLFANRYINRGEFITKFGSPPLPGKHEPVRLFDPQRPSTTGSINAAKTLAAGAFSACVMATSLNIVFDQLLEAAHA